LKYGEGRETLKKDKTRGKREDPYRRGEKQEGAQKTK
jgi:hypothetical protein